MATNHSEDNKSVSTAQKKQKIIARNNNNITADSILIFQEIKTRMKT